MGSALICFSVGRRGRREIRENTLYQLLFGLSLSDIISTTAMLLGPFLVPKDASTATTTTSTQWAIGNTATCTATAFFLVTFGAAATFYNFFISLHFWRSVRAQQKQNSHASADRTFQISAHCCSLIPSFIFGFAGLLNGGYRPHEFLTVCYTTTNTGKMISRARLLLMGIVTVASVSFTVSLVRIFRARFRRSSRYTQTAISQSYLSRSSATPVDSNKSSAFEWRTSIWALRSNLHFGRSSIYYDKRSMDTSGNSTDISSSHTGVVAEDPTTPHGQDFEPSTRSSSENPTDGGLTLLPGLRRISSNGSDTTSQRKVKSQQKEVAVQAVWYTVAYLNSSLVPAIALIIMNVTDAGENEGKPQYFFLLWCLCFFPPIQGALNFVVYIRPRYKGWQAHFAREQERQPPSSLSSHNSSGKNLNKKTSMYLVMKMAVLEDVPRKVRRPSIAISTGAAGESMRPGKVSFAPDVSETSTKPVGAGGASTTQPIFHPTPPMASLSSSAHTPSESVHGDDLSSEKDIEISGMEESETCRIET